MPVEAYFINLTIYIAASGISASAMSNDQGGQFFLVCRKGHVRASIRSDAFTYAPPIPIPGEESVYVVLELEGITLPLPGEALTIEASLRSI